MHVLNEILLKELQAYFPEDQVEYRMGPTGGDDGNGNPEVGKPLFYIPARRVQQRLDNVVGPMDWQIRYSEPVNRHSGQKAGAEATILIRDSFTGEWVGKSDVSQNTETEGMKGGYSKGMVRAGVQWGIGRYLYFMPEPEWTDVKQEYGRTVFAEEPSLPPQYTPAGGNTGSEFSQEQLRQLRQASKGKDKSEVKEVFSENREDGFQAVLEGIRSL